MGRPFAVLVVALVLAAAGAVGAALWLGAQDGEGLRSVASPGDASASGGPTAARPALDGTGPTGVGADGDAARTDARRALDDVPPSPFDFGARTFQIRCVDGASGEPVPGAQVFVSSDRTIDGVDVSALPRPARTLREHGTPIVTDPNGVASIDRPLRTTHVAAWADERSGFTSVELPIVDGTATLALHTTRELTIEVRDASGAPVGGIPLDVGVQAIDRDGEAYGQPSSIEVRTSDGVDASGEMIGRVVVEWSTHLASIGRSFRRVGVVEVDRWSSNASRVTFDVDDLPSEPIVLTLAESGDLTVELRDGRGELVPGRHPIELSSSEPRRTSVTRFAEGGRVEFERVPLNRTWTVRETIESFRDATTIEATGPTAVDRQVVVELVVDAALVVGRAVDESGSPMIDGSFLVSLRGFDERRRVATDSEGRFAFPWGGRVTRSDGAHVVEADLVESSWVGASPRTAAIDHRIRAEDLGFDGRRSVTDVGDVVFTRGALLVQGRVVDAFGRPVPNIAVQVYERAGGDWSRVGVSDGSPSVLGARASEDGRFAIHAGDALAARARAGELYLFATSRTFRATAPVAFAPGVDLEIVVHSFGRVTGRIAGFDPDDFSSLSVYAHPTSAAGPDQAWTEYSRVDRKGGFELELAPGDWDLELSLEIESGERVIDVLERVEVVEGRKAQDPRLDPWEPPIRRIEVSVVDASGDPVDRGTAWMDAAWMQGAWTDTAEPKELRSVSLNYGTFAFYTDGPAPDVWILADDYESAFVRAPRDGLVVTLPPAPKVELAIHGPRLELPDSSELRFVLVPESVPLAGAPRVEAFSVEGFTDLPTVAELHGVHSPGAWTVLLHVARNIHTDSIAVGPSWSIDVVAGTVPQRFEIELEQAHVDRALELLREGTEDF